MRPACVYRSFVIATVSILSLLVPMSRAAEEKKAASTATTPVPRDENWLKRHEGFVEIAKKGGTELLFLGDSITDGWRGNGQEVWKKRFEPLHAANFGIGGDRTQHVLWRITHGELEGMSSKAIVLMIGTNNSNASDNTAEEIAQGVTAIVHTLHEKLPNAKVLLLAIFPRGEKPNPQREKIREANERIAKLDDGKQVRYLDIGPRFMDKDGTISKEIMYDYLHLTPEGYEIWAEAIEPSLKEMMGR